MIMNKHYLNLLALSALFIGGCATLPEKIAPSEISDVPYMKWSCEPLSQEHPRLAAALATASDRQRGCRKKDIAGPLFIGLPVGSLTGCRKTSEIARLKGELQALQYAAMVINCPLDPASMDASSQDHAAKTIASRYNEESHS
jgi:hypothetical protein